MCNPACIRFAEENLKEEELKGKDVLEVGSLNVNGSIRSVVSPCRPASYHGVDITNGPGVDEICDIHELTRRYGRDRYDVVICTELLEHVKDWRSAVSNLKNVLKTDGVLVITTRSKGFPYHGYPHDFWRYDADDLKAIFSDFFIESMVSDPSCPGVFMKARKKASSVEASVDSHRLYSVLARRRCRNLNEFDTVFFVMIHLAYLKISERMPACLKSRIKKIKHARTSGASASDD
jgi:SAM-dependent methyltransferase